MVSESALDSPIVPDVRIQHISSADKSLSDAAKSMRKRLRSNGFKGEIQPVPEGDPMFLFFRAKGRVNGVNTFFDSGCSTAVFREGVPGTELRARITQTGPFIMNGVGGIKTKANNLWLVSMDLANGNKQFIQGLSVDRVTSDFPMVNLNAAIEEVKAADVNNRTLQSCKIPDLAGGSTDLLLGIMYNSIHPTLVHQLPCGLAIYKSALASHEGKYTCMIGGPHKSFNAYAGHVGGASRLITCFVDGIQKYRSWGPPKLEHSPFTIEEELFAKEMNKKEGDVEEFVATADVERFEVEKDETAIEDLFGNRNESSIECNCDERLYCCKNVKSLLSTKEESANVVENISLLKKFITANEGGLNIEYRCVKCRECIACKKADETEKLSLREEQENQLIKESVSLDFENKAIKCTLPGRGPERDFLSSNKDDAAKVLLSVCKKYHDDPSAKGLILKAFQKLFDNKFVQLVDEMTPEEKEKFNSKEVQHFIPWRPVFADSVSTPCRPTFDASTRTKRREDGSAGRCLNDYVVKGSIDSMNLLRLILRWQVGKYALAGDLAQFYNKCKLEADQWNLQKFLWLENLDPSGKLIEAVIKTLIYGVKCVAAQSEFALEELANSIENTFPEIAMLLRLCRYVDDIGNSKTSLKIWKRVRVLLAWLHGGCVVTK